MKNKIKSSKEKGQAIVEMCVCLIPILVILLGMIFISGLGISNIRAFIQAKENSELASRNQNAVGGYGDNIYCWDYGDPDASNEGDGYPFTADDKIRTFYDVGSENSTEALITEQLNNSEHSVSRESNEYYFMPTTSLISIDNNYDSMLSAASLVEGRADNNFNSVFTLDSRYSGADEIRSLKLSFTHLFGLEVDDLDLREMRANTVYYPALPTETSGSTNNSSIGIPGFEH